MPERPGPDDPGEFSFADETRVRRILTEAGFAEISTDPFDTELIVGGGGDREQTVAYYMQIGPMSRALAEADEATRARVAAGVGAAIAPYQTDAGFRLASATWMVTTRRP